MKYTKLNQQTIRDYCQVFSKQNLMAVLTTSQLNFKSVNLNYQRDLETTLACLPTKKRRLFVDQVHGDKIIVDDGVSDGLLGSADGIISRYDDVILQTSHGDCFPVYASSDDGEFFGLAHAGREGVYLEIANLLVQKIAKFSKTELATVKVVIGAGIDVDHYQVNQQLYQKFLAKFGQKSVYCKQSDYHLDLKQLIYDSLIKIGVKADNISLDPVSTYQEQKLHSYRRDGAKSGRMLALMLKMNK